MTEEIKEKAMKTLKNLPSLWKDFDAKNCDAKQLINGLNTIVDLVRLTDIKDDEEINVTYKYMCDSISEMLENLRDGYTHFADTWLESVVNWLGSLLEYIFSRVFY